MINNKTLKWLLLFLPILFLMCQGGESVQLGQLDFEVHGKANAQADFKTGLLLLHSFEFDDAAKAFRQARTKDPEFVMAYWGEAMTYNHPLWRFQDKDKAIEVLNSLSDDPQERVDLAKSEVEKDLIEAIHVLYGEGSKSERDRKYARVMKKLYEKYPGHDEIASFYSIALLGSVNSGRDNATYKRAAEIAQEVISRNPDHPGALHYLIHAYDDPDNAPKAVEAADRYSAVAPSAAHALHMPSHIYLALGDWEKVIQSNEASWGAAYDKKQNRGLDNDEYDYHSFHWLMYAYLQTGQKEKASSILEDMMTYCTELSSLRARYHMVLLRSTYAIEMNDFNHPSLEMDIYMGDFNVVFRTIDRCVRAFKAYHDKDTSALLDLISAIRKDIYFSEEFLMSDEMKMCGGPNPSIPNAFDIQQSKVMEIQTRALLARLNGQTDKAHTLLNEAVDIEVEISHAYGPPKIVKPSAELMGEWHIEDGRPELALNYYNLALTQTPGRALSAKGKENVLSRLEAKEM